MASKRALHRLKRIRELEEEQLRRDVESAVAKIEQLTDALQASRERNRKGRDLVLDSIRSGDLADRLAGLEESRITERESEALLDRLQHAESQHAHSRTNYLVKRVEHRQLECLIEDAVLRDTVEAVRKNQQALDDGHGARLHRAKNVTDAFRDKEH